MRLIRAILNTRLGATRSGYEGKRAPKAAGCNAAPEKRAGLSDGWWSSQSQFFDLRASVWQCVAQQGTPRILADGVLRSEVRLDHAEVRLNHAIHAVKSIQLGWYIQPRLL